MSGNEKANILVLMLMGIIILLMVAIVGLFIHMNRLQNLILASLQAEKAVGEIGLAVGTSAPTFALHDIDGSMVSLQDFAGQKILLGFSSIQCPACAQMYPELEAFSRRRHDIQVVLISRGTLKENQRLVEEQGFDFPVLTLTQDDWEIGQDYEVPGTPFFYVIDEQGIICGANFANSQEHLESLVNGCR